jgi:hypothetical protein
MSDGFTANPGAGGSTFASDDVGGTHWPRLKISVGSDGVALDNWTPWGLKSTASTNANAVKTAPGAVGFISAMNVGSAVAYLKLYNKASAPTVGTDTPLLTIPIPASTTGAGVVIPIPNGLFFSTGIALALTVSPGTAATDAVAADQVFLALGYA